MSRTLALDFGERRIGVAVSDPTGTIAQPLPTILRRRGKRPPYTRVRDLIAEWDVGRVVIGLPVESSGEEGPQAERTREFGVALAERINVPVEYWDERLTSARARRELALMNPPLGARREKGRIDAMAAALILQSYLDAHTENR